MKKERSTENIRTTIWKGAINRIFTMMIDRSIVCLKSLKLGWLVSSESVWKSDYLAIELTNRYWKRVFGIKWWRNNYFIVLIMKHKGHYLEFGKCIRSH